MNWLNIFSKRPIDFDVDVKQLGDWVFFFYSDIRYLRSVYLKNGGLLKVHRLKGFTNKNKKAIHTMKGKTYTLGHEMEHALGLIGDDE
ncbi:hypothetical protein LCGC14_0359450 [marine sediment metagenome]|uniref:Uncharacterized protein n=1 Tax=marine sediment metagenome TaxID=412755 RepID=A0A0F9T8G8_9ZZZZ|nr:hypothetical protein [Candidatus Aminicenantes bacterium]